MNRRPMLDVGCSLPHTLSRDVVLSNQLATRRHSALSLLGDNNRGDSLYTLSVLRPSLSLLGDTYKKG